MTQFGKTLHNTRTARQHAMILSYYCSWRNSIILTSPLHRKLPGYASFWNFAQIKHMHAHDSVYQPFLLAPPPNWNWNAWDEVTAWAAPFYFHFMHGPIVSQATLKSDDLQNYMYHGPSGWWATPTALFRFLSNSLVQCRFYLFFSKHLPLHYNKGTDLSGSFTCSTAVCRNY